MTKRALIVLTTFILSACNGGSGRTNTDGDGSEKLEFKDQVAQGKVNGESYLFVAGQAHIYNDNGKNRVRVFLWSTPTTEACDVANTSPLSVTLIFNSETKSSEFRNAADMPSTFTLGFIDNRAQMTYLAATSGALEVISLTNNELHAKIVGEAQLSELGFSETKINGTFQVPLCL